MDPKVIAEQIAENNRKIEELKNQLAQATAEANKALRAEAIKAAKAKGDLLVAECDKAGTALIEAAKAKATAMVQDAMAKAKTMLERAEKGLTADPANPSRPKKGRVLPDGRVMPLGRGKPSPTWVVVDLATVDPALIVKPETTGLGMAVTLANSQADNHGAALPVVAQPEPEVVTEFILNGSDKPVTVVR